MSNSLLLTMGGIGSRFGSEIPKQFTLVNNKPIFMHILEAYAESEIVDNYILITNPDWINLTNFYLTEFKLKTKVHVISGGPTRSHSIKNAIEYISTFSEKEDKILIHDATHPYFDKNAIIQALGYLDSYDGVTLCQREYDTCYFVENDEIVEEIPKKNVVSGASPELFHYGDLNRIYLNTDSETLSSMSSAGVLAKSLGMRIKIVSTSYLNLKITHPKDMELFRVLSQTYYFKVD